MQKVSKQSLAMIALSILLAISIALTFTFAVLSDKKTATGTITFSGDASVAWTTTNTSNSKYVVETGAIQINLTNADFDFKVSSDKTIATIKSSVVSDEFSKVTVTIKNGAESSLSWKIEVAQDTGKKITLTETTGLTKTGTLDGVNSTQKEVKLSDIIDSISVADVDSFGTTGVSFTITASIAPATAA